MNIRELSRRSGVSLTSLRKLNNLKVLKIDADDENVTALRIHLSRNQPLRLSHVLMLTENPNIFAELDKQEKRAREQMAAFGDIAGTLAPRMVALSIGEAASGDATALDTLADYVQSAMPAGNVRYHYFAARIVLAQYESQREATARGINLAFAKMRGTDRMAGWWHLAGKEIFYHRPLAEMDL